MLSNQITSCIYFSQHNPVSLSLGAGMLIFNELVDFLAVYELFVLNLSIIIIM